MKQIEKAVFKRIYVATLHDEDKYAKMQCTFTADSVPEASRVANEWAATSTRRQRFSELQLCSGDELVWRRCLEE